MCRSALAVAYGPASLSRCDSWSCCQLRVRSASRRGSRFVMDGETSWQIRCRVLTSSTCATTAVSQSQPRLWREWKMPSAETTPDETSEAAMRISSLLLLADDTSKRA